MLLSSPTEPRAPGLRNGSHGVGNWTCVALVYIPARQTATLPFPVGSAAYGDTHPAKFIWPFSILIIATGLIGFRSGPMEIFPETP